MVLSIAPEDIDARYNLGVALSKLRQHDQAIEAYREAVRIGPTNAESWNNLGVAYFFRNQHDKVREVCLTLRKWIMPWPIGMPMLWCVILTLTCRV